MIGARRLLPALVDATVVLVLLTAGLVGFGPVFGGSGWAVAAGLGAVLGLGLAVLGAWRRWSVLTLAGAAAVAYLLVAGPVAARDEALGGIAPSLASTRTVLVAAVHAWKDVLTLTPPVGEHPGVLAVPLLTGLIAALVALSVALRSRRPWWALLPATAAFVVPIVLGGIDVARPVVQGLVFGVVAVGWSAWRHESGRPTAETEDEAAAGQHALAVSRLRGGAVMLAAAGAVALIVAPMTAAATGRHTLREQVVPPLNLEEYHSPLVGFRGYVKDHADDVLFTVSGLPAGGRVRLATLDGYDGVVYDVTDEASGATFEPVSGVVAGPGTTTRLDVSVQGYHGVWLPDAGDLRSVEFTGTRADELKRSLYYDSGTGVAIATAGLAQGDAYGLDVVLPQTWTAEQLAGRPFATQALPDVTHVPDAVTASAGEMAGAGTDPITAVTNLEAALSQGGFFSHGLAGETASRAGHTAERIATMLGADQMIGDDEQYAVAMALMARQLGIPARVVMGFYPPEGAGATGAVEITGDDVHAWVEVAFQGVGWVPFDPTPPQDQTVTATAPLPKADPRPQVLQPPDPVEDPDELPPDTRQQDDREDDADQTSALWRTVLAVAGLTAIPVLLIGAPLAAVAGAKRRRRRRRLSAPTGADRASGGWYEVLDRAVDLGTPVHAGSTRRETVSLLTPVYPGVALATLADRADASTFAAGDPTDDDVLALWAQVEEVLGGMSGSVGYWRRLRARFSLRSLRAEHVRRRLVATAQRSERPKRPGLALPRFPARRTGRQG